MNINETCCCGAQIVITDSSPQYVNPEAKLDAAGDRFVYQKVLREFRLRHQNCQVETPTPQEPPCTTT